MEQDNENKLNFIKEEILQDTPNFGCPTDLKVSQAVKSQIGDECVKCKKYK